MEIFSVLKTGETAFIGKANAATVKDALLNDSVLLIIDDDTRLIWLWKGNSCSVAKKFIGARISQEVRGARGLTYKVIPVDQDEEPDEFKLIYDAELAETPQEKARPPIAEGEIEEAGPIIRTLSEDMKNTLMGEAIPNGFEREAIIVGKDFYGVVKSVAKVLGKEVVKEEIQKTSELPDGVLFNQDYGLRFLIKEGNVAAIEILKRA
ncbi:MAG: hypothetical protein ACTSRG_14545 [Candidatus Helarchaeota archaeon]